jgi:indole-3-glycerol phosphate synthase
MDDVLAKIIATKRLEIKAAKARSSESAQLAEAGAAAPPRGFVRRIEQVIKQQGVAVIAEIKKASPSKGLLRDPFAPADIARSYEQAGAACLSVLTDHDYFQGEASHLAEARSAVALPALRKDFVIDPYQVAQSRVLGADCILLIVSALEQPALLELADLARQLNMDVLIEVHDEAELARSIDVPGALIGINNRNLRTFQTDLAVSIRLARQVPSSRRLVSESGIATRADLDQLENAGIHAFLVGETFMRATDPGTALATLLAR